MARWDALSEDLELIFTTDMAAPAVCNSRYRESRALYLASLGTGHIHDAQAGRQANIHRHKIKAELEHDWDRDSGSTPDLHTHMELHSHVHTHERRMF